MPETSESKQIRHRTLAWLALMIACGCIPTGTFADTRPLSEPVETPRSLPLPPVTLTATRAPEVSGAPILPTVVFDHRDLRASATPATDDLLRRIPNFSLFRRTSSLAANPTTQGASLRGIGPSGTSRALVLYDGIPFNDAFGGWVYWSQIDLLNLERIEVVRGGGSTAWGNTALGGVIHLIPRSPTARTLEVEGTAGNLDTRQTSFYASDRFGSLGIALEARYFSSDGFIRVRPDQRGAVDIPTDSEHELINLVVDYAFGDDARLTMRGSIFNENRGNGTPLSHNETDSKRLHSKLEWTGDAEALWRIDAYVGQTDYANTFSSVAADRNSEQLVLDQYSVPSKNAGGSIRRTTDFSTRSRITLGADLRWVEGSTNEYVVFQGDDRHAGGSQLLAGVFLEQDWQPDEKWHWQWGARGDYWRSYDGYMDPPNGPITHFTDREEFIFNARLGTNYAITATAHLRGAVYQGFRTPTINELYRPFQVGADVTRANAGLDPERLIGGEIGLDLFPSDRLAFRATAFANQVRDPILNVTIGSSTQGGQLRQRRNIERTEILGFESELDYTFAPGWRTYLNYALTDARVSRSSQQPELEGNRLAQVPQHVVIGGIAYESVGRGPGFRIQGRWNGDQFEDDLNERRLAGYLAVDLSASYTFAPGREIFVGVENLFDRRAPDAITGNNLVTETAPRTYRAGLRLSF